MNLRAQAKGRPCMIRLPEICSHDNSTVVLAHVRLAGVSGMGVKAPDALGAWACAQCHNFVDTHEDDATRRSFFEGVMRTQYQLIKEGLL